MNGIKMSDCKFYVDEEARVVVCVITDTKDMFIDFIREHFIYKELDFEAMNNYKFIVKDLRMPRSFMGKAVCAKDDEWDEELGRLLAFSRAKDKCYKSFFRRANLFVNTIDRRLNNSITILNDFGEKLNAKREHIENMIEQKTQK